MRLDHVSYAAEADGVDATAARLGKAIGVDPVDGGLHPRMGVRAMVLPLAGGHYIEVLEALEHPATLRVPFGRAVRARTATGGGWLSWVVSVDDLPTVERRLSCGSVPVSYRGANGAEVGWRQVGVLGSGAEPQLPVLSGRDVELPWLAAVGDWSRVRLCRLRLSGDPGRVSAWLGAPAEALLEDVEVEWTAPRGTPGFLGIGVDTPDGQVVY